MFAQHALAYAFSSPCLFFLLEYDLCVITYHCGLLWMVQSGVEIIFLHQTSESGPVQRSSRWTCRPVITADWSHGASRYYNITKHFRPTSRLKGQSPPQHLYISNLEWFSIMNVCEVSDIHQSRWCFTAATCCPLAAQHTPHTQLLYTVLQQKQGYQQCWGGTSYMWQNYVI